MPTSFGIYGNKVFGDSFRGLTLRLSIMSLDFCTLVFLKPYLWSTYQLVTDCSKRRIISLVRRLLLLFELSFSPPLSNYSKQRCWSCGVPKSWPTFDWTGYWTSSWTRNIFLTLDSCLPIMKCRVGTFHFENKLCMGISNVIYSKVYLIRLFNVSHFLSNYIPMIYHIAR